MRPSGGWATAETRASVQPSRITSGGTGAGAGGVGPEDEEEPQPEASSRNASTANLCTTAPPFQLPDSLLFGVFLGRLLEHRIRSEERRVGKECRSRWS